MAVTDRKKTRNKLSGSLIAALVVLLLVIGSAVGYFWCAPVKKTTVLPKSAEFLNVKPSSSDQIQPQSMIQEPPYAPPPTNKESDAYPLTAPTTEDNKAVLAPVKSGLLAVVVDDMGSSLAEARSLAAIRVPITFAIIPGLHADQSVAAYAASQKIETMIHIPMQPKGWPERRLETNGLLVSMEPDELQGRVTALIQQFPEAVGVNNHMGSEFTEQEEKMVSVLQVLKKNNLFFIDSVTSPASVGIAVAHQLGLKSARRNVFLDNEQERSYILGQLNQAVMLARKKGSAIVICHPHPVTIATLAAALPRLAGQGIQLVMASQLVK